MFCKKEKAFFSFIIARGGFFNLETVRLFQGTSRRTSFRRIAKYLACGVAVKPEAYACTSAGRVSPFLILQDPVFKTLPEWAHVSLPKKRTFNKQEAAKAVQTAHAFLEKPDWILMHPDHRRKELTEKYELEDRHFSRFKVRRGRILEEIVRDPEGKLYVVYAVKPEGHFSLKHDFEKRFLPRWQEILLKGLRILTLSFGQFDRNFYETHRYYHNDKNVDLSRWVRNNSRSHREILDIFMESWHRSSVFDKLFFGGSDGE